MLLPLLTVLTLTADADACSIEFPSATIVSPSGGSLPAGFGVFLDSDGSMGQPQVHDAEGNDVELAEIDLGAWRTPDDLEPGTYEISKGGETIEVEVGQADSGDFGEPALVGVYHETERVAEGLTASCREVDHHRHVITTLDVELPGAQAEGWVVQVEDRDLGHLVWMAPGIESSTQSYRFDAGRTGEVDELCITLRVYDPAADEVWSEELPCEGVEAGCNTVGGRVNGVGMLALLGLSLVVLGGRRGRVGERNATP